MSLLANKEHENILKKYSLYWAAGIVTVITGWMLYVYPEVGQWHGILEAIFIASLLMLTVDPFTKQHVTREVSKDMFYYILGFRLPEELQRRLHQYLQKAQYYRKSLSIVVQASLVGQDVVLDVEENSHIVALTDCPYHQSLAFEDVERGEVLYMWARWSGSPENEKLVEWRAGTPGEHPEDLMTLYKGQETPLRPGDQLAAFFHYKIRGRKTDYWIHTFGTTTLKTEVTLKPKDGIRMFASGKKDAKPGEKLEYDVFIRGEDIHIRWELPVITEARESMTAGHS